MSTKRRRRSVESLADVAKFLHRGSSSAEGAARSTIWYVPARLLFVCLQLFLGALLIESCICMSTGNSIKAIAALNFNFNSLFVAWTLSRWQNQCECDIELNANRKTSIDFPNIKWRYCLPHKIMTATTTGYAWLANALGASCHETNSNPRFNIRNLK